MDECGYGFIGGLKRIRPQVGADEDCEVFFWSQPRVGEIHGVAAAMIKDCPPAPLTLHSNPTECRITSERRFCQDLVTLGLEQGRLTAQAPQLVGNEEAPVLQRAIHATCGSQDWRVIDARAIPAGGLTGLEMSPGLIDLARSAQPAE